MYFPVENRNHSSLSRVEDPLLSCDERTSSTCGYNNHAFLNTNAQSSSKIGAVEATQRTPPRGSCGSRSSVRDFPPASAACRAVSSACVRSKEDFISPRPRRDHGLRRFVCRSPLPGSCLRDPHAVLFQEESSWVVGHRRLRRVVAYKKGGNVDSFYAWWRLCAIGSEFGQTESAQQFAHLFVTRADGFHSCPE